ARGRGTARAPWNDHRRAQRSHAIRRDRPRVPRSRRLRVRRSEDATRGILRGRGRGRGSPQARADRAARARVARAPRRARGALAGRRSCSHDRPVGHARRIARSHSLESSAMATIALPLRRGSLARVGTGVPLVVGMVGTLASWLGSGWDVSWHRIFGRDTFWTTPHLFIYVGVSLWGIAALFATVTAMAGRPIRGRALVVGPLRAELGIALIGIGALITILAAPFDNAWHAAFGRDVDIWSPPHIFGIAGVGDRRRQRLETAGVSRARHRRRGRDRSGARARRQVGATSRARLCIQRGVRDRGAAADDILRPAGADRGHRRHGTAVTPLLPV